VYFQQGAGTHYDPVTQHDPVTGYPDNCAAGTLGVVCATSHTLVSYGYPNAGFPETKDAGLVILDIADRSAPRFVSQLEFGSDVSTATHTALPLPGRDVLVVTDEQLATDCRGMQTRVRCVDISDASHPTVLAEFPVPEGDFCLRGGRFGPHNAHEMRRGSLSDPNTVYVTWFNAGLRVFDVSDAAAPREIAYFVPEAPPGRSSIQFNDVLVDATGLVYVTDRFTGGLYVLERTG